MSREYWTGTIAHPTPAEALQYLPDGSNPYEVDAFAHPEASMSEEDRACFGAATVDGQADIAVQESWASPGQWLVRTADGRVEVVDEEPPHVVRETWVVLLDDHGSEEWVDSREGALRAGAKAADVRRRIDLSSGVAITLPA